MRKVVTELNGMLPRHKIEYEKKKIEYEKKKRAMHLSLPPPASRSLLRQPCCRHWQRFGLMLPVHAGQCQKRPIIGAKETYYLSL